MQFTGCDHTEQRDHWLEMQLTGCHNGNEKRNATCAASKTSKAPTQDALLFISYSMDSTPKMADFGLCGKS